MVEIGLLPQCLTFAFLISTSSVLPHYHYSLRVATLCVKMFLHGNASWELTPFFFTRNSGIGFLSVQTHSFLSPQPIQYSSIPSSFIYRPVPRRFRPFTYYPRKDVGTFGASRHAMGASGPSSPSVLSSYFGVQDSECCDTLLLLLVTIGDNTCRNTPGELRQTRACLRDLRIEVVVGVLEQESKIQTRALVMVDAARLGNIRVDDVESNDYCSVKNRSVSISSGNNLPVISVFGYTTIMVVYDGLMRVTDGNKVEINFEFETRLCVSHIFDASVGTTMGDIGIWELLHGKNWFSRILKLTISVQFLFLSRLVEMIE
ncbi:hypothetical protein Tco_0662696 [Tanacetum coccineum]